MKTDKKQTQNKQTPKNKSTTKDNAMSKQNKNEMYKNYTKGRINDNLYDLLFSNISESSSEEVLASSYKSDMNKILFSKISDSEIEDNINDIEDYRETNITNIIHINKPKLHILPNRYRYENWVLKDDCTDYITNFIITNPADTLRELNQFIQDRVDLNASMFRRLTLSGNGHFKTKAMSVNYSTIDATAELILSQNGHVFTPDNDLKQFCYNSATNGTKVNKDLYVAFIYAMFAHNNLIHDNVPITTIEDRESSVRSLLSQSLLDTMLKQKIKRIIEAIHWPKIDSGEFFITTAAEALAKLMRELITDIEAISTVQRAYRDLLPLAKLDLLNKKSELSIDMLDVLENPKWKALLNISNFMNDALETSFTDDIRPSYVMTGSISVVYDAIFNNNDDIILLSENDLKRYFTVKSYQSPVEGRRKVVTVSFNKDCSIDRRTYLAYVAGKIGRLKTFTDLDNFSDAIKLVPAVVKKRQSELLDGYLLRFLRDDDKLRKLRLYGVNESLLIMLGIAHANSLALTSDSQGYNLVYTYDLRSEDLKRDFSLIKFGNKIITTDVKSFLFYTLDDVQASNVYTFRENVLLNDKSYYKMTDIETYTKKQIFKQSDVAIRLLSPSNIENHWVFTIKLAINQVLMTDVVLSHLLVHQFNVNLIQIKDRIFRDDELRLIRQIHSALFPNGNEGDLSSNARTAGLFINKFTSAENYKLFDALVSNSVQLKAVEQYAWLKCINIINEALKSEDASVHFEEYKRIIGDSATYDVKFKMSLRVAIALWYLELCEIIDSVKANTLYDAMVVYINEEANLNFDITN